MRRLALLLALCAVLTGCASPGKVVDGGDGDGEWSYGKGPHGENCLFYQFAVGSNSGVLAMSCDSVKP